MLKWRKKSQVLAPELEAVMVEQRRRDSYQGRRRSSLVHPSLPQAPGGDDTSDSGSSEGSQPRHKSRHLRQFLKLVWTHLAVSGFKGKTQKRVRTASSPAALVNSTHAQSETAHAQSAGGKSWGLLRKRHSEPTEELNRVMRAEEAMKNLSTNLTIEGITNGVISAAFSLPLLPTGTLALRVRSNHLVLVSTSGSGDAVKTLPVGYIELPIFLDPTSLSFELCEVFSRKILRFKASTKCSISGRRHSSPAVQKVTRQSLSDRIKNLLKRNSFCENNAVNIWEFQV